MLPMRRSEQLGRQRLPDRLLIHPQRRPDRPEAHPQPPHLSRLGFNPLALKGLVGEDGEFERDLGQGSNWSQSRPPSRDQC